MNPLCAARRVAGWLGVAVLLAGCGAAAPASSQPQPSGGSTAGAAQDWDQVLAAAKKEGKVEVVGPVGDDAHQAFTGPFTQKYGITVDYLSSGGPEFPPRIEKERAAGLYSWDVASQGTSTMLFSLKPLGALDPIDRALILPEVTDPRSWRDGKLPYFDADHSGLTYLLIGENPVWVNTQQVNPTDIKTWRELLNPKWKGKILIGRDPKIAGYGQAFFQFLYLSPDLGPDFIRDLAKQELTVMRDDTQSARALGSGQFAICICSHFDMNKLADAGAPVAVPDTRQVKEGTYTTSSQGNIALVNRAPHPNAARVFINWVLSREGQATIVTAMKVPGTRVDAPTSGFQPWEIPRPNWIPTHTEEALKVRDPLTALLKEVSI
ncbi:MAG TPA: extracellular solute-binding protein [Chloroflexota bacterium]|nr:extracellular solute-binding protein [Chloroflexota bacterium]